MKLILTGGFLGSGKTTAIVNASKALMRDGKKIGVITNDQGDQQVDSAYVASMGIPVREVPNGCFCCNFNQLDDRMDELKKDDPEIIFAESVGSCTDLIATIAKPMNNFKPEIEIVISIFADASLISSILRGHSYFEDESVRYIYKKQLEEADLLILNKVDLLTADEIQALDSVIKSEFPPKTVLHQNSLLETHIRQWINQIYQFANNQSRQAIDVDYDIYGKGEAQLAWMDKTISIRGNGESALRVVEYIMRSIADQIQMNGYPIGHLKFFVDSGDFKTKVSLTSCSTGYDIRLPDQNFPEASLIINARVETRPSFLKDIVGNAIQQAEQRYPCKIDFGKWSAFQPGFPRPTHRILA
jgi:Ni2+-binding GTPase involved in maturation of urease and hydrogenase